MPVSEQFEDRREIDATAAQIVVNARHQVLFLRWRRRVAAIPGVGVFEMDFGNARAIFTASMPPSVRCPVSVVSQTYFGSVSSIIRRTSGSRSTGPQI